MAIERTTSIFKPDAVANNVIGEICDHFEQHGFKIVAAKMLPLSKEQAGRFYAVNRKSPLHGELTGSGQQRSKLAFSLTKSKSASVADRYGVL